MSRTTAVSETEARERALDHPCPDCGAATGVRCRILTRVDRGPGYPVNTKVDVRRKPCPDRVNLAWREMMRELRNGSLVVTGQLDHPALQAPCPTCGAKRGEECGSMTTGRPIPVPHAARRKDAETKT